MWSKLITVTLLLVFTYHPNLNAQTSGIAGYAVALIKNNKVVLQKAVGFADVATQNPYTTKTIQSIASISKSVVGVALMKAVDEGLVDLDEDINGYLPFKVINPHISGVNKITLRSLATHTSGIVDNTPYWENVYSSDIKKPMALKVFLTAYFVPSEKLYHLDNFAKTAVMTTYEYSNVASALVGLAIEHQAKMLFKDYVQLKIFQPLKMTHSGWSYSDIDISKHSNHYDKDLAVIDPYTIVTYPDGGLRTNIEDLTLFLLEMIKGYQNKSTLLSKASWQAMFRPQFSSENPPKNTQLHKKNKGIFWSIKANHDVGHSGADPGIYTDLYFNTETGVGKILLMNTDLSKKNIGAYRKIVAQFQ